MENFKPQDPTDAYPEDLTPAEIERYMPDRYHVPYKQQQITKPLAIFVSVASYRDPECTQTVKDLFEKAAHPERIFVGICQQNQEKDPPCLKEIPPQFRSHIRTRNIPADEARGPTFARYLCSHLWDGEEYFLQIDSHMRMLQDWDATLIRMYNLCPSPKVVLTHYPPSTEQLKDPKKLKNGKFYHTCKAGYDHDGKGFHIISGGSWVPRTDPNMTPYQTPYVAAGVMFARATLLKEVPFDPYLPHLFQGEEILHATRFWTHGWDIYNLTEPICTHHYDRRKDKLPHFWEDHTDFHKIQEHTNRRYYYLLGQIPITRVHPIFRKYANVYGMGQERSLQDYFKFAGMDLKNKKIESRCGKKYDSVSKQWK